MKILMTALVCGIMACSLGSQAQKLSDNQLKSNIQPIENPVNRLVQLEPVSFEYNKDWSTRLKLGQNKQFGFVAEDLGKVFPELVFTQNKDYPSGKNASKMASVNKVDLEALVPVLVAAMKEQQAEIENLKKEISGLKNAGLADQKQRMQGK
ncbi:DNA topoisomerase IV [Pedobacter yulinensis]|uniref:DNA topoisomerase IV n=1 Tax=Pedobacter yulinensis TaxID=2126353 RepID=A0A2T3HP82_9SPHI|nr:tail fiber domain-containing protein [Pedobacter yulinensis]PST84239.1 DNA topoisomerase IV [Pedobacter yulinensis]